MEGRDHLKGVGAVDRDLRQLPVAEGLVIWEPQGACSEAGRAAPGWFSGRLHGRISKRWQRRTPIPMRQHGVVPDKARAEPATDQQVLTIGDGDRQEQARKLLRTIPVAAGPAPATFERDLNKNVTTNIASCSSSKSGARILSAKRCHAGSRAKLRQTSN
jgi:hypothetical protein